MISVVVTALELQCFGLAEAAVNFVDVEFFVVVESLVGCTSCFSPMRSEIIFHSKHI